MSSLQNHSKALYDKQDKGALTYQTCPKLCFCLTCIFNFLKFELKSSKTLQFSSNHKFNSVKSVLHLSAKVRQLQTVTLFPKSAAIYPFGRKTGLQYLIYKKIHCLISPLQVFFSEISVVLAYYSYMFYVLF